MGEGEGCSQSHEGDVSTCHVVVITCAAVAARLVVVALVRRSGDRDGGGGRERGSCEGRDGKRQLRLDFIGHTEQEDFNLASLNSHITY